MDCTTADDFNGVDWIIKNFSYWNGEIQSTPLTTKGFEFFDEAKMELYPRGPSGQDDNLVVRLIGFEECHEIVSFSYIGPDGSLLCSQEIVGKDVLELPPGPRFEDVVALIKRNEGTNMDQLTLRLHIKCEEKYLKGLCQLHSVLDVYETSLKISFTSNDIDILYWVKYPSKDGAMNGLLMEISSDSSKVQFIIKPDPFREKVAFNTFVLLKNIDGSVLRTEDRDHVFLNKECWTFSNSLTIEEVTKGVSVFINFKITPSNSFKHLYIQISLQTKKISITPTKIFRPLAVNSAEDLNGMNSDQPDNNLLELSKELMCLYQDQGFSDFLLKCEDVSIPVHKAILSARSPVFKTMLSTDMKEAASNSVDIVDLDPSTLTRFLSFLYTGTVEDLKCDSALKLYYVADKYQVPSLKRECVSLLCAQVSISNVCDILSLANKHQNNELTGVARDFILKHYNEVLGSEEWGVFMKDEPLLAVETLTNFAKRNVVGEIKTS